MLALLKPYPEGVGENLFVCVMQKKNFALYMLWFLIEKRESGGKPRECFFFFVKRRKKESVQG